MSFEDSPPQAVIGCGGLFLSALSMLKPQRIALIVMFLLLGTAAANLVRYRSEVSGFFSGLFVRGAITDAARWQSWAKVNAGFFAPLRAGTQLAILPNPASARGLIFTKKSTGMEVRSGFVIRKSNLPVIFVMDNATASEALAQSMRQGNSFWDWWKSAVARGRVRVFVTPGRRDLRRSALLTFLQAINVRAP